MPHKLHQEPQYPNVNIYLTKCKLLALIFLSNYYVNVFVKALQLWWSCDHVDTYIALAHQELLPSSLSLWKALVSWIVFEFKMFLKQWQGKVLHLTHRHFWTILQLENCHFLWVYGPVTLLGKLAFYHVFGNSALWLVKWRCWEPIKVHLVS